MLEFGADYSWGCGHGMVGKSFSNNAILCTCEFQADFLTTRVSSAGPSIHLAPLCEHQLRPQCPEQHPPLNAHGVRHGQHQLVALGSSNKRKPNTCVATGRLNLRKNIQSQAQYVV